jgi:hypothetical protein
VTATTAAAMGPASSAAASGFLREILMDLGLELALAAAAAFLWGELMVKVLPPPTGEVVLLANGDAAAATGTATALEDAWRRVVMPTAPATGDAAAALAEDTAALSMGGTLGAAPDRCAGGGEGAPPPLEPLLVCLLRFPLLPAMVKRDDVIRIGSSKIVERWEWMVGGGSDAPLQLTPIVLQNKKLHESAGERNCHSDYGHRTKSPSSKFWG